MNIPENYQSVNKHAWNLRTGVHVSSDFYNVASFLEGQTTLNETELGLLGEVQGRSVLHLQCHFGLDSLSLARMGAKVTGIDLSDAAITKARELNESLQLDARFICCDVYDTASYPGESFDIIFTSYGVIGWLPDLTKWAAVIKQFLKPGGKLVFVEFHPVVWMFDSCFSRIDYSYFNRETITEETTGTYTDREAPIRYREISWNHSLDEVFGALTENGISITGFREYDFSHYNCFAGMHLAAPGRYQVTGLEGKLPMMYSITGTH